MVLKSPFPDVRIPSKPFGKYMLDMWKTYGDSIAVIDDATGGATYTYKQLHSHAVQCASMFRGMDDMVSALSRSNPKLVFIDGESFIMMNRIVKECVPTIQFIFSVKKCEDCPSFWSLLKKTKEIDIENGGSVNDAVMYISTSGTTGKPKDIILTSANMVSILTISRIAHRHSRKDVLLMVLPLFRGGGFMFSFMCLDQGATLVVENSTPVRHVLQSIDKRKATLMIAVPNFLYQMAKCAHTTHYDTSSLNRMICGAAPMPKYVADLAVKVFGATIIQSYGLSECMKITSGLDPDCPQTSVGTLNCNIMLKVIDLQTRKELGTLGKGELCVKAPQLMKGYLDQPGKTAQCIDSDGWFHTGDYGYYDSHGYVYVIDRITDLIHCGQAKLAPQEFDNILLSQHKIADAAVVGVPHEELGEVPVAFVVKKDANLTEEDILHHISDKMDLHNLLRGRICFIKEIPRAGYTKVQRKQLRERWLSDNIL